ncbi:MAG: hypothetical protein J7L86_05580 [Candidatus Marinimicrobia bacterium]|nr:hypothetical protein [Candidatus Neomarinimicrobiota bacterium]
MRHIKDYLLFLSNLRTQYGNAPDTTHDIAKCLIAVIRSLVAQKNGSTASKNGIRAL